MNKLDWKEWGALPGDGESPPGEPPNGDEAPAGD